MGTGYDVTEAGLRPTVFGAYPIVLVTYEIVCSEGNDDKLDVLKAFLGYTATEGQATLDSIGAAPLPTETQEKVTASVQAPS